MTRTTPYGAAEPVPGRPAVPVRGAQDRRRPRAAAGAGGLLLHHGVTGEPASGLAQQQRVNDAAGAILLDGDDPSRVLARTAGPLLAPKTDDERSGIVPNVVFPTAIEEIDGLHSVFYGMADSKIGVARLDRSS